MYNSNKSILAGDIGGTHARFACLQRTPQGDWKVSRFTKVKGADFKTFDDAIESYLEGIDVRPQYAAFAAAGPVEDSHINLTNTDWQLSADRISALHQFERCGIYNDFAGMTRSIPELSDEDFTVIRTGQARANEPVLVAGAGTGFGVGYLVPTKGGWHVVATEGGHIAYSPQSPLEFELLQVLKKDRDFVSLELVCSGSGLPEIHKAVCEIHGKSFEPMEPQSLMDQLATGDAVARDVCHIRAAATMGAIGDLALSGGARGGIVLAGGVSERMLELYKKPKVMERFLNRGPQSDYVRNIPMGFLNSPFAPLIGAAILMEE